MYDHKNVPRKSGKQLLIILINACKFQSGLIFLNAFIGVVSNNNTHKTAKIIEIVIDKTKLCVTIIDIRRTPTDNIVL